ncbi:VanZ family protein [Ferviditalea candida]|uniref:VanZ family protein n=1 Tax=Ferviditalea candida TaxID=3108399 RepID=A0ABU5ZKA3_9BACL|nr:VanZ family protein [Paenibacillaceae bacterium T2]
MIVLFIMSSQTGQNLNKLLPFFREILPLMREFNWGHFWAYFILAIAFLGGRISPAIRTRPHTGYSGFAK